MHYSALDVVATTFNKLKESEEFLTHIHETGVRVFENAYIEQNYLIQNIPVANQSQIMSKIKSLDISFKGIYEPKDQLNQLVNLRESANQSKKV